MSTVADRNLYRVNRHPLKGQKRETPILIWEAKASPVISSDITIIGHFKTQEAYLKAVVEYNKRDGVFLHFGVMPYVMRTCPHCLQTFKTEKMIKLHEPLCSNKTSKS
jgi:hypothetical protein